VHVAADYPFRIVVELWLCRTFVARKFYPKAAKDQTIEVKNLLSVGIAALSPAIDVLKRQLVYRSTPPIRWFEVQQVNRVYVAKVVCQHPYDCLQNFVD